MARRLEDAGVALVTIHGRTTEMRFSGQARLDGIAEVVAAVKQIPVIGNGDVKTPQDAAHMLAYTKCAGVMIGRGALSQPWLLRDCWSYLSTGVIPPEPTIAEKVQAMRYHFRNLCRFRHEKAACNELRKRVSWYAKSMNPCWMLKERVRLVDSADEFEQILVDFLDWRHDYDNDIQRGKRPAVAVEPEQVAEVAVHSQLFFETSAARHYGEATPSPP